MLVSLVQDASEILARIKIQQLLNFHKPGDLSLSFCVCSVTLTALLQVVFRASFSCTLAILICQLFLFYIPKLTNNSLCRV